MCYRTPIKKESQQRRINCLRPRLDTCLSTWIAMCFLWPARTPSQVDKSTREVGIKAGGKVKSRKLFSSKFFHLHSNRVFSLSASPWSEKGRPWKAKGMPIPEKPKQNKIPARTRNRDIQEENGPEQTDRQHWLHKHRLEGSSQGPLLLSRLFFHLINTHYCSAGHGRKTGCAMHTKLAM